MLGMSHLGDDLLLRVGSLSGPLGEFDMFLTVAVTIISGKVYLLSYSSEVE